MELSYRRLVTIAGVLLAGLTGLLIHIGDLPDRISLFLTLFAVMFAIYAGAVFLFARHRAARGQSLALIFIVAVACRVVLIGATPTLSNDVYRYLWEGRVIVAGHNPFALPPDAPQLEHLRDANYESINHRHLETIYPPLAQGVFAVAGVIAPTVTAQKLLFTLFDLATIVVIVLLLRRRGMNTNLCVIYAWSPLVIIEFAHSGHMDPIAIFFLMLAIYLFERGRAARGMAAIGLSFLAKLLPIMLAPWFVFRKRFLVWLPLTVAIVLVGYLPFAGAGGKLWSSLEVYGRYWQFNSLVYRIVDSLWSSPDGIRLVLAGAVALYSLYQARRENDLAVFAFRVVGCAILLSPTLYPWYVTWIVPLLCIRVNRAWLYFSGAVVASYAVLPVFAESGEWRLDTGFLAGEYVPFYLMLLFETIRSRKKRAA